MHHCILARDAAELIDIVHTVLVGDVARTTTGVAVLANVDGSAFDTVVMTSGLVNRAGLISDVIGMHIFEGGEGLTTVATVVIHGARDDSLR